MIFWGYYLWVWRPFGTCESWWCIGPGGSSESGPVGLRGLVGLVGLADFVGMAGLLGLAVLCGLVSLVGLVALFWLVGVVIPVTGLSNGM